jgi:quinol monooxygenase YgiN
MSIIKKSSGVTLINVFTVEPGKQQELVSLLIATEQTMKHMPGFVSANIHRSLDGKKVVNYAQWESRAAFEAMRKHPKAIPHMKAAASLAQFEPILCEASRATSVAQSGSVRAAAMPAVQHESPPGTTRADK